MARADVPRQLAFDLPARPSLTRGDFFVSSANDDAVALIDTSADWPNGRLVLAGPEGSGKTHLANVWHSATGAPILAAADLAGSDIPALGRHSALIIEAMDTLPQVGETPAFHLLNLMMSQGGRLLMTARVPPSTWKIDLPDLASRVQASGVARLNEPDDALLAQLLLKLFADRQINPEPALIQWLAARIDRSFAAAEQAVDAIDTFALSEGQNVTRALARKALNL
ncbi:MAG: chromosomal replication initiator DnaA [Pseudomonadota bacterium]